MFDRTQLKNFPNSSGVYQMFDNQNQLIYVGKAKNLKKRTTSYFSSSVTNHKTLALVQRIERIEVIPTISEIEALILEHNIIKQKRPHYNILLRDDKTYPFVAISQHDFPRVMVYRTKQLKAHKKLQLFGPYPNSSAATSAVELIYQSFQIRNCSDASFANRTRPCLMYQIKRCSAPCVNLISKSNYQCDVEYAKKFLQGKNQDVIKDLVADMNTKAKAKEYEQAAAIRDRIGQLQQVLANQTIRSGTANCDVLGIATEHNKVGISQLQIRHGNIIGNQYHPLVNKLQLTELQILAEFIGQYYLVNHKRNAVKQIIVAKKDTTFTMLQQSIAKVTGEKFEIVTMSRGLKKHWLEMAKKSAIKNLKLTQQGRDYAELWQQLQQWLNVDKPITTLECFDISHNHGVKTVASCVVFDQTGEVKQLYRRYNLEDMNSDDYLAMRTVLLRRYSKMLQKGLTLPSVILIDGGRGQLNTAQKVLDDLKITDIILLSIVKGEARKSGLERFLSPQLKQPLDLNATLPLFHCLQYIRDEAHRFAITGHRNQLKKTVVQSPLLDIDGIGPTKRKRLLDFFGGLQQIEDATVQDLSKVPGINQKIAASVYEKFHSD